MFLWYLKDWYKNVFLGGDCFIFLYLVYGIIFLEYDCEYNDEIIVFFYCSSFYLMFIDSRYVILIYLGIFVCEVGCILELFDKLLEEKGFIMLLDLGVKGRYMCCVFSETVRY